jgi:hypothetical protein
MRLRVLRGLYRVGGCFAIGLIREIVGILVFIGRASRDVHGLFDVFFQLPEFFRLDLFLDLFLDLI